MDMVKRVIVAIGPRAVGILATVQLLTIHQAANEQERDTARLKEIVQTEVEYQRQERETIARLTAALNDNALAMTRQRQLISDLASMHLSLPRAIDADRDTIQKFGSPLPTSNRHRQLMHYGLPGNANIWFYDQFIVSHNYERKIPNWVVQRFDNGPDKEKLSDRKKSNFTGRVPHIDEHFRADNKDYLGSGWSRGHMVPASDMARYPQTNMDQTFLLNSNIVPQNMQNNGNFWTFVKHEVIGDNNVAVPSHLFKVILLEQKSGDAPALLGAFVIPNEPIPSDAVLTDYQVSLQSLERSTGLTFFPRLATQALLPMCDTIDCKMMTERELDIWNIPRRIGWSKNRHELDRVMDDCKKKDIDIDDNINQLYQSKLRELDDHQISSPTNSKSSS
ncbi:hypothetical protein SAMD00019534_071460 [Acytostelium subglobosum LB1]|uniref:hypothetical protein n=1 Tax=Acytostelium subglobosum LB1 TaxID=1410327 RepID=UPI00064511F7|nr:hypothetical protein SAMD00019534_071460 [Acytostelium subglobosum LB1]GAM23971.1 hypothetical protein SAMD00019534_071460 [Acytostelium subglobosum LB1]|eukprot:XP_012753007.1 hypothetical protein SAMD00019534_071460 [Acytostelium subglobosum LB1]